MVGTGIEKYSAEAAASITRQAEATQYNAGYQAMSLAQPDNCRLETCEQLDSVLRRWPQFNQR